MTPRSPFRAAALSSVLGAMIMLGAVIVPGAQLAHAAAAPVSTKPVRYAALTHAPRMIALRFSEAIVSKSSSVQLTDLAGHQVRVIPVKPRDKDSLEARIAGKLSEGVYMVHWTAVSAVDGSKTSGRYQFTVQ